MSPDTPSHPPGSPDRLERRLAAILSTDVQGYSRLMSDDDEQTVRTLIGYRALMTDCIQRYHGRVVDSPGDNLLAEFGSVVAAVQCAVTIQHELKEQNAQLSAQRQMVFRIGINLGDVIVEDERLYGDGVNIAARLEGLAEGGGICLSGSVYDQVQNKLDKLPFEYLGERTVKNIAQPVRVYRIRGDEPRLAPLESPAETPVEHPRQTLPSAERKREHPIVGRQAELEQLERYLAAALQGKRQLVFVTGEPGIGKTTLVDAFLERVSPLSNLHIASGQCIEQYGRGEAYLPLLEASSRLCRTPEGEPFLQVLYKHAPTWLAQLPALVAEADMEALQRRCQGTTRERMLREMAEALEVFSADQGTILVLEDVHWSDVSTLEWLAYMARRREAAKLLIIGTYRPADVLISEHPLKGVVQELQARGQCEELRVPPLRADAIGVYLAERFAGAALSGELPGTIHHRTGGNPLFMVNMVEYLGQQGVVVEEAGQWTLREHEFETVEKGVPDSLRQLIEKQLERLGAQEQRVLEVASVAGVEFSAAATAAGLQVELEEVETRCGRLARRGQFLQTEGLEEWPDGTLDERYSFRHALYQDVLYDRVREVDRVRLHRRIGLRKEAAYGDRANEIAAELAVHFERGRDTPKAIQYLELAGQNALRRSAEAEAIRYLQTALTKLTSLPPTPERDQQELSIQIKLGTALMAVRSWSAPEVGEVYARARTLCQQLGQTPQLFQVLVGLRLYHMVRAECITAYEVSQQLLQLAGQQEDTSLLLEAHHSVGASIFWTGEYVRAKDHIEQALAVYDPQQHNTYTSLYGQDPGISGLAYAALILWALGYPDQAQQKAEEALRLAHQFAHPFTLSSTLGFMLWLYQRYHDLPTVADIATEAVSLSTQHGFVLWEANATFGLGWELAQQGQHEAGIAQMQHGLADYTGTGAEAYGPSLRALLAEAYGRAGQVTAGLELIDEALELVKQTGEYHEAAELFRVKGKLLLAQESPEPGARSTEQNEAAECFQSAIEIAQRQEAKSWELRAAMSLGRLWQQQGKTDEARELLEDIYGWFTEGFETHDLQEAYALLKTVGSQIERNTSQGSETGEAVKNGGANPVEPAKYAQLANPAQPLAAPLPVPSSISEQPSTGSAQQSPIPPQSLTPNPHPPEFSAKRANIGQSRSRARYVA